MDEPGPLNKQKCLTYFIFLTWNRNLLEKVIFSSTRNSSPFYSLKTEVIVRFLNKV